MLSALSLAGSYREGRGEGVRLRGDAWLWSEVYSQRARAAAGTRRLKCGHHKPSEQRDVDQESDGDHRGRGAQSQRPAHKLR